MDRFVWKIKWKYAIESSLNFFMRKKNVIQKVFVSRTNSI